MKMFLPFKSLLIAGGFSLLSFLYVGAVPVASSVQIAPFGPYVPGNVITANYIYTDTPGSDAEANSIIHWYTSPNSNGSGATTIATLSSANAPVITSYSIHYTKLYDNISLVYLLTEEESCEPCERLYTTLSASGLKINRLDYTEQAGIYTRHLNRITSYNVCYTKLLRFGERSLR